MANPIQVQEIIRKQQGQIQMLQRAIEEQARSTEVAIESENKAVLSMLSELNTTLTEAHKEIHERITTLEITLEAFIKLVLVSNNPSSEITEEQLGEIQKAVMDFITPKL